MNYTTAIVNVLTPSGTKLKKTVVVKNNGYSIIDNIAEEIINQKYECNIGDYAIGDNLQVLVNGIKSPWYRLTNTGFVRV